MKKHIPIYIYGAVIILEGLFLLFASNSFDFVKITTGVTMTIAAILAYYAAFTRRKNPVQFAYHGLHALAMLAYGVFVLAFCDSFEALVYFTAFLFVFYSFSEITFCTWLYNLERKVVFKTVIIRLMLALAIGIGTIIAMNFSEFNMVYFGVLFIAVGINILFYAPAMKVADELKVSRDSQTLIP